MRPRKLPAIAAVCLLFVLGACAGPMHMVDAQGYGDGPKPGVTLAQVQSTIQKTAEAQRWQLSDIKTGSFVAKRSWDANKHNIVVDVVYGLKDFSIRYKDSKQMGYDGNTIHRSYNRMVRDLESGIKANVSKLTP